ncbi:hypothetical protein [Desmospora activa]|uniref:Uncharacterized protein n=1 Tax=Desmospora activa DSM 45169 TaxID=1121389 RepID=A0A2T4Z4K6_9BACL|nr:hypothetical protein [Desmospora activa]PTM56812.1 hypothetical protein C8J48_3137 [Desmospora activa DSM 45169]
MEHQHNDKKRNDKQGRLVNDAESLRSIRAEDLRDTEENRRLFDRTEE